MTKLTQAGASKTLGVGNATVTSKITTPIPMRLAATTNTVRISWIRIRWMNVLSSAVPSSQEP
ncbi:Uncharacterised protein [Mycobacteroides abscessus subsp. abscessus]|nr:Uncharacterised protein [Mycobacteroides abscessus subsp. abscessus]SIL88808.1 Uncharacterised protein [Mycobacteroides abscessus subsp. abscessus]SIN48591.1 Uncharacterised protein [Mycobacteroides abscessus subsp. abscessus]